ncbi:hypothetical protein CHA01nite_26140 [Chryseobacterium hagamense]|uniref:Uncharacterized protein n=1 Tax=Chryseobacterium hagamense TaxID=395935 RepID=A0A511YNW2_9FLAO|nr:hypothetical protein CHA01nite_26140 [Chryseobacterium hagamense]
MGCEARLEDRLRMQESSFVRNRVTGPDDQNEYESDTSECTLILANPKASNHPIKKAPISESLK